MTCRKGGSLGLDPVISFKTFNGTLGRGKIPTPQCQTLPYHLLWYHRKNQPLHPLHQYQYLAHQWTPLHRKNIAFLHINITLNAPNQLICWFHVILIFESSSHRPKDVLSIYDSYLLLTPISYFRPSIELLDDSKSFGIIYLPWVSLSINPTTKLPWKYHCNPESGITFSIFLDIYHPYVTINHTKRNRNGKIRDVILSIKKNQK